MRPFILELRGLLRSVVFVSHGFMLNRMFTIKTKNKPINITTFELDVRATEAGVLLSVEVYTLPGGYSTAFSDESAWTQVANTKAVSVPGGGGVIIPVQEFSTVSMLADELRSFYITLQEPFLDSKAEGLSSSGDIDADFDAFTLNVGSGLAEYKFPATFDNTVSPKFAGVIHFKEQPAECSGPVTSADTTIEYKFLIDDDGLDDALIPDVNDAIDVFFFSEIDDSEGHLKEYGLTYQVQQRSKPSSTSGGRQTSK